MIIDPIDLKILRHLEAQGYIPLDDIINKFHITRDEIFLRIKNFEEHGLIKGYGIKLFIPSITGGKWYRGCAFVDADYEPDVKNVYPLVEEVIANTVLPAGILPAYSYIFYSRDLKQTYRLIMKTKGVKYVELYKIAEYDMSLPHELTSEEWQIINQLVRSKIKFKRIYQILDNPINDEDVQLSRLMLNRKNLRGVFSVFPNIDWSIVKNFAHIHFAVTAKMRPNELKKFLRHYNIAADIYSKFKKKFLQLEFDLWGFSDLNKFVSKLRKDPRINVLGISIAHHNEICDEWIKNFIREKAH